MEEKLIELLGIENADQIIKSVEELIKERTERIFCVSDDKNVFISSNISVGHILFISSILDTLKQDLDGIKPWRKQ